MKLEHKIELRWLILFALPTIFSNVFGNLYTAVDGIFVARFVDTDALSAINISMPMAYLTSALGMMFGTGGNALIAKKIDCSEACFADISTAFHRWSATIWGEEMPDRTK